MALEVLQQAEKDAPVHHRVDILIGDVASYLKDRRGDLTDYERKEGDKALAALQRLSGSIKTRVMAKKGQIGGAGHE
ncbi:MAG: hypothetical protein P4M15_07215 [Alphaproteobacteria bacterium]|nr:hypothetical protein [Alphaproteobacteria bacterium]